MSLGQIVGFLISIAGVALTASHGEPSRLLELDINFGDAIMVVGVVVYSLYTVALRYRPAIHWQSLMIVLTAAAFVSVAALRGWPSSLGCRHRA